MGILKQLGLLLKQNLIERKRRWAISLLELGWPIVLLIVIVTMRDLYPVTNVKDCKYEPRAMPSSGVFPFMQSYVCNLDAKPKCVDDIKGSSSSTQYSERTRALRQIEETLATNEELFTALSSSLEQSMPALEQFSMAMQEQPEILEFLNATGTLQARDLFKDAAYLRDKLVKSYGLDEQLVDAILDSTINISKGIELLQGVTVHLCDMTNTSTPLMDYLVLPANSTSNVQRINEEICGLEKDQITQLIDLLQEQLDVSAVMSLAKKLMSLFTPSAADVLSDIERMINVVRSLSSFKGLSEQVPSLEKALQFATQLLSFVRKAALNMPINPNQIASLLEQLDPLITRWSNNSPVWRDIKRGIYYIGTAISWVSDTLDKLPEMKISFGDLYTDGGRTILDLFNVTAQDSGYFLSIMSRSSINLQKVLDWQNALMNANNHDNDTLCQASRMFFDSFEYPADADKTRLDEAINRTVSWYCHFDPQMFVNELNSKTNFDALVSKLTSNSSFGSGSLDWKTVISAGWDLVNVITRLQGYFEQYAGLIEKLINMDFNGLLSNFQRSFSDPAIAQPMIYQIIGNVLDYVESILKSTPVWQYIRRQLIYQNLFAELINDATNLSIEATNITYMYIMQNQTEDFVLQLVTLNATLQQEVLQGLTKPSTVRTMLKDPQGFHNNLCSNLTGLLDLHVDVATEQELDNLFCKGSFVMPPGVSQQMQALGVRIQTKVDMLVEAFSDVDKLNATKYDSFATLSAQLKYNSELTEMIGKAATDIIMSKSNALQIAMRSSDWFQNQYVVPYAVMATIMDTLGEALENTDGWSVMAPYIRSIDDTVKYLLDVLNKQKELLSEKRMTGRILDWILTHGPRKFSLTLQAMKDPAKMAKVMELLTGGYPLDILQIDCNQTLQNWFYGVGALDTLPMDELKNDVCNPSMPNVVYAEVLDVFDPTNYLGQVQQIVRDGDNSSIDWVDMSKSATDLPKSVMQTSQYFYMHFDQYDWRAWANFINETLQSLNSADPAQMGDILKQLDVMFGNSTEWRITKYALNIADVLAEQLADRYQDIAANGLTLNSLFVNSTQIKEYLLKNNQFSSTAVDALFDTLIDPTKLFSELITGNFTGRVYCQDLFVSQFIEFKNSTEAKLVDEIMCGVGAQEFLAALQTDKVSLAVGEAVMELTNGLIHNNLPDIEIDYPSMVVHITDMVQAMMSMQNFTGPYFPEFLSLYNGTAMVLRYQAAFDNFIKQDPSHWPAVLDGLIKQLKETPNLNNIGNSLVTVGRSISTSVGQSLYSMRIILQQLREINNAAKANNGFISLKDLVLPGQLRNVLEALDDSPEMTDTLLYSLIELVNQPQKLAVVTQLDAYKLDEMCKNLTFFEYFFSLPPGAVYTTADMQSSMCSFKINVTVLLKEMVDSIDGFKDLITLYQPTTWVLRDDLFSQMWNVSAMYSAAIEELVTYEYRNNQSLKFDPPRWLNQNVWSEVLENMQNYSLPALQRLSQAEGYAALIYALSPMIDQFVRNADGDTRRALAATNAVLEYMVKAFDVYNATGYNDTVFLSGVDKLSNIYEIMRQLPDFVESVVMTSLQHPDKIQSFVSLLTTPQQGVMPVEIFCSLTDAQYKEYFVTPAGNNGGFSKLIQFICYTSRDQLIDDLRMLPGGDSTYFENIEMALNASMQPPPYRTVDTITLGYAFYERIYALAVYYQSNPEQAATALQANAWVRVARSIDNQLRQMMNTPFNPNLLLPIFKSVDLNVLAPQVVPYIHTAMAIANLTLRRMQVFNQTHVDIMDQFKGYPVTIKAMQALNMSFDIVELLMTGMNSVKVQLLFQMPPDQILPTLCNADWADYFSVGPQVDLEAIKTYVCTTNWTAVYHEQITYLDIPYIESQLTNNSTVEWEDVIRTVNAMSDLISDIVAMKPTFKQYPWMNESAWNNMILRAGIRLSTMYTSWEYWVQSSLASLTQSAPLFDQLIGNNTQVRRIIFSLTALLQQSADIMQDLSDNGWELSALFDNTTETSKLVEMMDELPGYIDIALQTILQPEKIAPLVKQLLHAGNNSMQVFCAVPDLTQYVIYDNKTDLAALQHLVCSGTVNYTAVVEELQMLISSRLYESSKVSDEELRRQGVVGGLLLSISQVVTQVASIQPSTIQSNLPYWVQPHVWQHIFNKFAQSLSAAPPLDMLRILKLQQMLGLEELLGSLELPQLHVANAVLDVLIEKLELLNRTEINITTVLESSPSAVQALDMLQYLPDIVEILMASGRTQQFSTLFSMADAETALTALCTKPTDYLSLPQGSVTDLNAVVTEFCSNNWTVVVSELMADVNFDYIRAQMNNTSPVDMQQTINRVVTLSDLIQQLIANPPKFIVDSSWTWLNATVWDEVFSRLNTQQLEDLVTMVSQYFYGVFVPMFGNNPEFQKFSAVLESLLTSLKYELNLWNRPGQNLTVADIIAVNSDLGEFIAEALELSPQMYSLFLSVSIRNPGDLQLLFSSPDTQALLCNESSKFMDHLTIPADVNMTAVNQFICSTNFNVLLSEIMDRFNIPEIVSIVQSNGTVSANWTKIQSDLREVATIITQLITNAPNVIPPFDINEFGKIAQEVMAGIDWQNADVYLRMTESLIRYFSAQPYWSDMEPYLKISQLIQTWMSDMMSRLSLKSDLSINLADLFPNATLLNEYLQASLALDQQTSINLITGVTVKAGKLVELFMPRGDNGSAIIDLVCNSTRFADIFSVPEDVQVKDLSSALCNMISDNGVGFVEELQRSLKIDTLIQKINKVLSGQSDEVFDARASFNMQMALVNKIVSLANATDVMYNNINLRERFAMLSNETVFQSYILALAQSLPPFELKMVGDALNGMMPWLRSMEWWNQSEKYFRMMNVMAEIGANRTAELPAVNLTLNTLIRDADTFKKLLSDVFAFTPDLFESLLTAELTISPVELIKVNSTIDLQDLICTAKFPAGVNVTAVKIIICDTDFQKVLDEILIEFDFDLVIQEIGKINVYSNVPADFDWNDLLSNTNNLAQNLGLFFTSLRPPPVNEFFLYKGNMTAWLERLSSTFTSSMTAEAAFKRLGDALSSLESSLSGRGLSDYKSLVVVSQMIQNYLDLAISELSRFNETVTLSALLADNADLVDLFNATAAALPDVLELLMTQPMSISQLTAMLSDPSIDPCTMDLSTLFVQATPADVVALQDVFCAVNITHLFDEIREEVVLKFYTKPVLGALATNGSSPRFDWSAYMGRFVKLSQVIEQMVRSPPAISPGLLSLVNVTEYMKLFDRVQKFWMSQQFSLDANSFDALMKGLDPLLASSEFGQQLSKYLNIADVILSNLNGKLGDIVKTHNISLATLFGNSPTLRDYLENVMNLSPETVTTILISQPSADVLRLLIAGRFTEVCSLDADNLLILPEGVSIDLQQVKSLFCDANITAFIAELSSEYGVPEIIKLLSANTSMPVEWKRLFNSSQELSTLLAYLATNNTVVDQSLIDAFNFSRFAPIMESLKEYDPRSLLRLLDAYGPLVQEAAGKNWPTIQLIIYQYSTGLSTSQRVLADLVNSGFTFESLMNNRTALIEFFDNMFQSNLAQAQNGVLVMYQDQITALLQRSEIQDLLCNETAVRTILPNLPAYIDLSSVFCGVKNNSWVDELRARNYSLYEVIALDSAVSRWYFDLALDGKYTWDYIYSYRTYGLANNSLTMNTTLGDLAKPVRELIDVLGNLGTLPPQFFPGMNMSYWMPLVEALGVGYTQNFPELVLKTLEMMDPILRDSEFWQQMRTALTAVSKYMGWINDRLEALDKQGQAIRITQLFPDIDDIKSLLMSVMSPEAVTEFFTIHFNPSQLITILQSDPTNLFCDRSKFNESFKFPEGVDVTSIQQRLCDAASNNSLVLKKVWELFDMKQLIDELARLTGSDKPTAPVAESPFQSALRQIQRLLQNANVITRIIQSFSRGMPDISSYMNMLLTTVNTVLDVNANNIGSMCDALVNLIDEVPDYQKAEPYLVRVQIINSIAAHIASSIDELDDFLCDLPSMNMSTLISRVADTQLIEKFFQVDNVEYLEKTPFVCSKMIRDAMLPQEKIQHMIVDAANGSYKVCIDKLMTSNFTLANDLNLYLGVLDGLRNLLASDSLNALRPLLEGIMDSLLSQVQASRIGSLFNQTALEGLLDEIFNHNSSAVSSQDFLNTFVNVDKLLSLINMTRPDAESFVCDPTSLNDLIFDNSGKASELSKVLCVDTDKLAALLQQMAGNLNSNRLDQLAATKDVQDFISQIVAHIESLLKQLQNFAEIPDLLSMLGDFDLTAVSDLLPKVTKLINSGNGLDTIIDDLIGILDLLETRLPAMGDSTQAGAILDDVKLVLNGIRGLKTLRDSLKINIPMSSVINDPTSVRDFLRNSTTLTDVEINDFLNSYFTSSLLTSQTLSVLELSRGLCDEDYLKTLLVLPDTSKLTYADVSQLICNTDPLLATNISLVLIKNLQVSEMIAKFVSEKYGVNTAELRAAAQSLAPLHEKLSVAIAGLSGATTTLYGNNSFDLPSAQAQTGAADPNSLSSMLCGGEVSGYEEEKAAISIIDVGDDSPPSDEAASSSPQDSFNGASLNNTRCDTIRQSILKQEGGNFIWSALKPLFIGKILYTPDNELTRNITQRTNATFEKLAAMLDTVKVIVETQDMLHNDFNSSETLNNLKPKFTMQESLSMLKDLDPSLIKLLLETDLNVSGLSEQLELFTSPQNQAMLSLLSGVIDFADCISLDRFQGVESEEKLEELAAELYKSGEFIAGLVFMAGETSSARRKRDTSSNIPKHVEYKIRMDIENVESTLTLQELFYSAAPRDNLLYDMRYMRGFIQIQEMVDRGITNLQLNGRESSLATTPTLLQLMPATCYNDDTFMGFVFPYIVPIILTLSWLFSVAHCIKTLTAYKETGLEELMKIMGLKSGVIWWSWFINTYLGMVVLSAIATLFLKIGQVLVLSDGIIIFLYVLVFSFSTTMLCYMIGSFFTKANVAAAIGVMLYFLSYMPYIIYTQFREEFKAPHFHASSLMSTTAFAIGATYISRWEQMGEGVQWSNIHKVPGYNEHGELSVKWMFIWMMIDSFIYLLIGWYVRNINPGKFGHRQPLYFPFTKNYWGFGSARRKETKGDGAVRRTHNGVASNSQHNSSLSIKSLKEQADWLTPTEPSDSRVFKTAHWPNATGKQHTDLPVGISIEKLKKVYNNGKVAVDDLDMVFYEGHVTAFLGRNGAGKTTTINMLTGMTAPTAGNAVVKGWGLDGNGISNIRQNLGYCPQFDMLFDFMTVKEHLDMFAALKSSDDKALRRFDVEEMLNNIGLWSMRNELVGTLSGGMQRRLSVAIAFIGNSKVIVLDEPTSSIDPNGRRAIWDLILKNRAGKTIVLCTHHLDEADTLGDRVAILDKGRLRAEGSPMSLKKDHASGYQLFLEKTPSNQTQDHDVSRVTQFITQFCPSATLMNDIGSSLTYSLPTAELPKFDNLFTELDEHMSELGISGFGISDSTLDEVFEKITDEDRTLNAPASAHGSGVKGSVADFGTTTSTSCSSMLSALFRKRFLHTIKDFKTYFALILLPCAFIALALGVTLLVPDRTNQPDLELQTALYPNTYSFYSLGKEPTAANAMASTLRMDPGVGTVCMNSPAELADEGHFTCEGAPRYEEHASGVLEPLPVCTCSIKSHYDCVGDNPQLDIYITSTRDRLVHVNESYDIQDYLLSTYNHYKASRYGGWTFDKESGNQTTATVWYDNRAFHSSPSYLNALSNMIMRAALGEMGESASDYGITVHNHPLLLSPGQLSVKNALEKTADLGISLTFLVAFTFIPAGLCVYLVLEHIKGEKHLQYVYGVGPIRYWLVSYLWDLLMFVIPIGLCLLLMYAFGIRSYTAGQNLLAVFALLVAYAWAVLPFMYSTVKLFKNTTTAFFSLLMVNIFLGVALSTIVFLMNFFKLTVGAKDAYYVLRRLFLIFPQYGLTSALIQLNVNQALVDLLDRFDEDLYARYHPFSEDNGIFWNIISLVILGVVFFIITLLIDLKSSACKERISAKRKTEGEMDDDVVNEKKRVLNSSADDNVLTVKGLSKQYRLHNLRRVLAVKDLNFGVKRGEVFGLCGVNGAGKTTSFRMLTGEVLPTEGSAGLHGINVTSSESRRLIGYCPQVNSLDAFLTGRQTLHVYAQLKNISDAEEAIANIIKSFGMQSYIDKEVKSLSGGMKRNLCVSIALLGSPDLVFLDEPTAGMDPVARRTVWNQILAAAARGCAVVLTSHSMTECEALCHRIAIMLNGKLACLGSSQHLKNKFGLGYTVKVKVTGPLSHVNKVINFVTSKWRHAEVKDQHLNTIEFSIPHTGGQTLASLFSLIEKERDSLYIEEYSVFQTTLDQVFIQFARNQQDQIEGSSDGDTSSSIDTESSVRYSNAAYSLGQQSLSATTDDKANKTLQNLDGEQSWNTYL